MRWLIQSKGPSFYGAEPLRELVPMETPDALTVGVLRLLYSGQHMTRAVGKEKLTQALSDYVAHAMAATLLAAVLMDASQESDDKAQEKAAEDLMQIAKGTR